MSSSSEASGGNSDPPSAALMQLLAPDGYYIYLGIPKVPDVGGGVGATNGNGGNGTGSEVDEDVVKKNYRKLSLKHHPDKGGDAETFRVLNRAKTVLSNPKLRQQYDILGLDLDDDEEHQDDGRGSATDGEEQQTTSQGIVHEIAGMALTSVLQMGVRTLMMATVSLLIVRFRLTLYPALAFLAFIAYRIHSVSTTNGGGGTAALDVLSPFLIGVGLVIMHQSVDGSRMMYWVGESVVIGMFTYNSIGTTVNKTTPVYGGIVVFSCLAAAWFRGNIWNYAGVIALEVFLAIFIALAFPIMEMVLEAVLNDKLKKVGDKVRAHHQAMERYYNSKR